MCWPSLIPRARLHQLQQGPIHQRSELARRCLEHLTFLLELLTLAQAPESATVTKLRATVVVQAACQAKVEQQLQQAKRRLQQATDRHEETQQQLQLALQTTQQHQAELAATLVQLQAKVEAAQTSCQEALTATLALPVSHLGQDQAHTLCTKVLDMDLPYLLFQEHGIDGVALVAMGERDVEQLFGVEQVGLRHRLMYCIQHAAHAPSPELLSTDFKVAEAKLQLWLAEQDGVSAAHQLLIAQARFDITTCGDVTPNELGMAKIPFAARKPLLKLLQHAQPALQRTPSAEAAAVAWQPEVQRAVLEQVLQENKALAARLSQQHGLEQDRRATVPDEYLCPITCEVMEDPVIAEDGQTYEREAIATWVASAGTSPITRQWMANIFFPNRTVKGMIAKWREEVTA